MEEFIKEIKKEFKELVKQKQKIEQIKQILLKSQNVIKTSICERNKIQDKNSFEYKLACSKIEKEEQKRKKIYEEWIIRTNHLEKKLSKSKEKFLKQRKDKSDIIYNNIIFGNLKIEDIRKTNIEELKQEKNKLEKKIKLAQTSDDYIEKVTPEQRKDVYDARKNLNNNQEKAKEIEIKIQLSNIIGKDNIMDTLRELQELKRQIEKIFNMEFIKELNNENANNMKKEKKEEGIDQLNEKWTKFHEYYIKCCNMKKTEENQENKEFLEGAQAVLKRKMKQTQEEYYIMQYKLNEKNQKNYKKNDTRSIKERIVNISMADIADVNEKAQKELEENKKLYEEDDKIINEIISKLDTLYNESKKRAENTPQNTNVCNKSSVKNSIDVKKDKFDKNKEFRKENKYEMTKHDIESVRSLAEIWQNKIKETNLNIEKEESFIQK